MNDDACPTSSALYNAMYYEFVLFIIILVSETSTVSCYPTSLILNEKTVLILEKVLLSSSLHLSSVRTTESAIFRRVYGR